MDSNKQSLLRPVFLLAGFLMIGISGTAFGVEKRNQSGMRELDNPIGNNERYRPSDRIQRGPEGVRMPNHWIEVKVYGPNALGGRKVRIALTKSGGSTQTETKTLDGSGDTNHRFNLGSFAIVAQGTYTVDVTQGPENSTNYTSTANYCFNGTVPATPMVGVVIDNSHRSRTLEFEIQSVIAWDRYGWCW